MAARATGSRRGLGLRGGVTLGLMLAVLAAWVILNRGAEGQGAEVPPTASAAVPAPAASILDQIPARAFAVATVDVAALRATSLGQQLLGRGREVAGLGEIASICGADPMDDVEALAVAVPQGAELGFGIFATGRITVERLLGCAEKIVREKGGDPVRRQEGGFTVLADAGAALSSAEFAARDGGPFVLGEPAYVALGIALHAGRGESARRAPEHASLRMALGRGVAEATVVLDAEQRRMLASELEAQGMADSPFVAVRGGGLSLGLDRDLRLHAVLRCDDAQAAVAVAKVVDLAREDEAKAVTALVSGLDLVMKRLVVRPDGDLVHLEVAMPLDDALALAQRLMALRRLAQMPPPATSAQPSVSPSSQPSASAEPP
ncbi:MAG: hypothetical protein R3B72_52050 [Polyangiaceae bacterium]